MPKTTDGLPVVIYARYSTDRQDARSIDDQFRRCRAHAEKHGFKVIAEYKDAAISGAHVERAGMEALLAASRAKGAGRPRAVLVDDLSRLSRDLGNTWQLVFHDLASVDVNVVDVTTGMSSDGEGARLTFGAMALVNDQFLQNVRKQTHRGLEGRALGGFWTGGRCHGYTTVTEENPPDPEHPRKRSVIDPAGAALVVRVFRLFAEGKSVKKIAATLNEEGIAAPNDGGRGNKNGRGWGHTTIRAMLQNERYLGRSIWNQSKWVRVAGQKSRRRVTRPESEWVTQEHPELAIVSRELWDAVQARFQRVHAGARGRPAGTGTHVYLVSGLMHCGTCGGSMTIVGRKQKAGESYARFGCTAHASRGASICANALSVSEKKASAALVTALKEKLGQPELVDRFIAKFLQRTKQRGKEPTEDGAVDRRVRDAERRLANLTETIAKLGWSDAVAAKLREEEAQLGKLKAERTASARNHGPRAVPPPGAIAGYLQNLLALLETDPVRGREILARCLGPIVMTPKAEDPDRGYRATGAFNMSFFLSAGTALPDRSGKSSCAGRI